MLGEVETTIKKLNLASVIKEPLPTDEVDQVSIGAVVRGWTDADSTKSLSWRKIHGYFDKIGANAEIRQDIIEELKPFASLKFAELREHINKWWEHQEIKPESLPVLKALFKV